MYPPIPVSTFGGRLKARRTCIQTPPRPPIHQRRLNTHPSQALEQCFVARLQLALILPTRRKGLKGQQLRILLTPFGPALDGSGPLIGPGAYSRAKRATLGERRARQGTGKGREEGDETDEKGFLLHIAAFADRGI
jgi:hypothetical protein